MNQRLPKKIRYEYNIEKEVRLNYTHGVWGGINPQGEIELNFYCEHDKLPSFTERLVSVDGTLGLEFTPTSRTEKKSSESKHPKDLEFSDRDFDLDLDSEIEENARTVVRNIHSKILVNYQTARALLEWLEEKIEILDTEEMGSTFPMDKLDIKREQ